MISEVGTTNESCDGRPGGFLKALQLVAKASAARRKARRFIAVGPPSAGRRLFLALQCRLAWQMVSVARCARVPDGTRRCLRQSRIRLARARTRTNRCGG